MSTWHCPVFYITAKSAKFLHYCQILVGRKQVQFQNVETFIGIVVYVDFSAPYVSPEVGVLSSSKYFYLPEGGES